MIDGCDIWTPPNRHIGRLAYIAHAPGQYLQSRGNAVAIHVMLKALVTAVHTSFNLLQGRW